ncbi:hypothetical protein HDV01_007780 [Terramyces sp. JEL0728]|nr:hypothetical protein HDV01_007780 [Terramyces sp. JEL0728]
MTGEEVVVPTPTVQSMRITVRLDQDNPAQNIFNFAELVKEHTESIQQKNARITAPTATTSTLIHKPEEEPEVEEAAATGRKRRPKFDPEDDYDVQDDFIDDSELFDGETQGLEEPQIWQFGFFAWKGSIETLFQNSDKAKLKKSELHTEASAVVLPPERQEDEEKDEENEPGQEKKSSPKKPVKKRKSISKADPQTPAAAIATEDSKKTQSAKKQEKKAPKKPGKLQELVSPSSSSNIVRQSTPSVLEAANMPSPVLDDLEKLRVNAEKADFTLKSKFPPELKPFFIQAVGTALDYNVLNTDFWQHKLASRSVYEDRILKFKDELAGMYKQLEQLVGKLVQEQAADPKTPTGDTVDISYLGKQKVQVYRSYPKFTEGAVRKAVYQTMVSFWPAGLIDGTVLSMQYSVIKKKKEKAAEKTGGFQFPESTPYGIMRVDTFSKIATRKRKEGDPQETPNIPATPTTIPETPTDRKRKIIIDMSLDSEKKAKLAKVTVARIPNTISAQSCVILLEQLQEGLSNLTQVIPDLDKIQSQILEIKLTWESMTARQEDIEIHSNSEISQLPPKTPGIKLKLEVETPSSPPSQHPFTRPDSTLATLEHWIYDFQKNIWLMNDKCLRYENSNTTILNSNSRKRKLTDLNVEVNTSWVNLMLNLGNILSQEQDTKQKTTSANLNKLAVATGITDWQELEPSDVQILYMQGEKYLLGCGVPQSFDLAYKRYQAASNLNYPEATNMLGVMNEFGIGHEKDMAAAVKYFTLASNQNNADAMNHLGRLYETGKGCEVSTKTAYALYKKASSLGQVDATNNYGNDLLTKAYLLEHGIGCNQNHQHAIETYRIAAGKGYARAQNALGNCYYKGVGVKKDCFQAVANYKLASDQGYAAAQNNLGICFEEGHGVPKDLSQAKIYYKKAADKKHANATSNLGFVLVLEGNFLEAIQQFYLAKALGSVDASYHLGYLYEIGCSDAEGTILHPDADMAIRFYDEAAAKGHARAILRLSSILICGPERLINIPKAVKYLLSAAGPKPNTIHTERDDNQVKESKLGDPEAQNILGELCEVGSHGSLDESPDIKQAIEWYRLAVKQGHARAMFNLAALYESGTEVTMDMEKAIKLYKEVFL